MLVLGQVERLLATRNRRVGGVAAASEERIVVGVVNELRNDLSSRVTDNATSPVVERRVVGIVQDARVVRVRLVPTGAVDLSSI